MNRDRRDTIKAISAWVAPLAVPVTLPVHAQCSVASIAGRWRITIVNLDGTDTFELNLPDENGNPPVYLDEWDWLKGAISFEIHIPGPDCRYTSTWVNTTCTQMSGKYNNAIGIAGPGSKSYSGTWVAKKT